MEAAKLIAGRVEVPEICRAFPIDWSKYEPTGGTEWLNYYLDIVVPTFNTAREVSKKELEKSQEKLSRVNSIQKGMKEVIETARRISEFSSEYQDGMNAHLVNWSAATLSFDAGAMFDIVTIKKEIAVFNDDVEYLNAVETYFNADIELDAVLFALYKVEPKYKAKLFRHVLRILNVVSEKRLFIKNSNSVLKKSTWKIFEPVFKNINDAYDIVEPHLRKLRRAARSSADFWGKLM